MNMEWLNHNAGLRGLGMSRTGSSHWRQYMVLAGGLQAGAVRCASKQAQATPLEGRLLCREGKMSHCQRNTGKKIN